MPESTAYVDESFHEHAAAGFYVLAAAVFDGDADVARHAMLELRGRRHVAKLHWSEMDDDDKRRASETVRGLNGVHGGSPGRARPPRRQPRASCALRPAEGTQLRVDHQRGADEPLFWVADIVAGAVRASRQGHPAYRDMLGDRVDVIEVDCG